MDNQTREALISLTELTQRQDSVIEQLQDLVWFANKLGMYDAADYLIKMTGKV